MKTHFAPATAEPSLEITYIPADRLFDKMKNLVEQPLQMAPGRQNLVSMETLVRVISCQTFERELLWKVSFHHQSFIVRHHLALEGQVVP